MIHFRTVGNILRRIMLVYSMAIVMGSAAEITTDNLPYGITITETSAPNDANLRETNITATQHGKRVAAFGDYEETLLYRGDLDGDGYEELVYRGFSGGAHCCFDMTILSLAPKMPAPHTFLMNNTEFVHFRDLDGDGKPEIITWDDSYSYLFFSFANSAGVKIVVSYDGQKLLLRPKYIKKLKLSTKPLKPSAVTIDAQGNIQLDDRYAPDVISTALHDLYSAQTTKAVAVLRDYLQFEHPALRRLFLDAFIGAMTNSPYWDELRAINHWQYETACFSEGCTPPVEYWSTENVVGWLFERMGSHDGCKN